MSMELQFLVFLFAISSSYAVNLTLDGTLHFDKQLLDALSDRLVSSLGNSRRSLLPVQEDKITSMVRYLLFKITNNCEDEICPLYKFIEEYIIVLAKTMDRVLQKALGSEFIDEDYKKQIMEYTEHIKEVIVESSEESNPLFWIVTIKIINSKFQQLSSYYKELSPTIDIKDLHQKIVLATVIMENNYLNILCVEHDVCTTKTKFTSALLAVLTDLTKAPYEKIKSFVLSCYKALFDTKFYSYMEEEFSHQVQVQLYEFVEKPKRRTLVDLQKILEDHLNVTGDKESTTRQVDLMNAILSDLDIIYVVQSSVPFTEFIESFYVFLKNDVKLNIAKIMNEIHKVISALASDFFNKLLNQVHVLINIMLSKSSSVSIAM